MSFCDQCSLSARMIRAQGLGLLRMEPFDLKEGRQHPSHSVQIFCKIFRGNLLWYVWAGEDLGHD